MKSSVLHPRSDSRNLPRSSEWGILRILTGSAVIKQAQPSAGRVTGSAVITHAVTTVTGYCLVGFNWIIDFLN